MHPQPRSQRSLTASLIVGTGILLGVLEGCRPPDYAMHYCTHGDPYSSEIAGLSDGGLEACVIGFNEIGPSLASDATTEAEVLSACEKRFPDTARWDENDPEHEAHWISETSRIIDSRVGCQFGARGYPKAPSPSDAGLPAGIAE